MEKNYQRNRKKNNFGDRSKICPSGFRAYNNEYLTKPYSNP